MITGPALLCRMQLTQHIRPFSNLFLSTACIFAAGDDDTIHKYSCPFLQKSSCRGQKTRAAMYRLDLMRWMG